MPNYRRAGVAGATYFFTVVTGRRAPLFASASVRGLLRTSVAACRATHAFDIVAAVVLPDHLHMIWTLPPGDADFSTRWRLIKARFTADYLRVGRDAIPPSGRRGEDGGRRGEDGGIASRPTEAHTFSRASPGERSVWQKRFWEHLIRDDDDLERHVEYIHYNPVKHGHATCPHAWEATSFHRHVRDGIYPADWMCRCRHPVTPPTFDWADGTE